MPQQDVIADYQKSLQSTAALLAECAATEKALREAAVESSSVANTGVLDIADAIDASLLKVNGDYLSVAYAIDRASDSEAMATAAKRAVQSRLADANDDNREDLQVFHRVYDRDFDEAVHQFLLSSQARRSVGGFDKAAYRDFCRTALRARNPEAERPSTQEIDMLIADAVSRLDRSATSNMDDEEIEMGESVVRPMCPISTKLLEEPVRARCGHYFSRAAIEEVLNTNDTIRCPSRGCVNEIERSQLVRDRFMDLRVSQWARKEERLRNSETQSMVRI